jgi:lysophospholipase L1-like esterase
VSIVVVGLGDSITAGNPGYDPDPARRPFEGDDLESQYLYWAARADARIEFRNHGVGGERADQILARFQAAAAGADVLVVQGGINDVVQGRSIEEAAADIRELVRLGKAQGLGVVVADVLPWNRGWPDAEPRIRALNELIRSAAAAEGVKTLPFHDTLEDPARPGRMRGEWTADGNHPSVLGHRRLGELAFELPPISKRRAEAQRGSPSSH